MLKISSKINHVYIEEEFLSKNECEKYINLAKKPSDEIRIDVIQNNTAHWSERLVDLTNDPIVNKVKLFLEKRFKKRFEIDLAQLQNWINGSESKLHNHIDRPDNKFNSILYLNEDFKGGVFYTDDLITVKPKIGMLTLFNGRDTKHGLTKVLEKDRFSILMWWKDLDVKK